LNGFSITISFQQAQTMYTNSLFFSVIILLPLLLTGPLQSSWYNEYQEMLFIALAQCIVLFGAKSEDRQERENFLNTFGKHLKAARVQKRLEGKNIVF